MLGIVSHLGVIGCTSKHVLSPSSHPLTPNPSLQRLPVLESYLRTIWKGEESEKLMEGPGHEDERYQEEGELKLGQGSEP